MTSRLWPDEPFTRIFLFVFTHLGYRETMVDSADKLTPVDPRDLAATLAFALRYPGRERLQNADEIMAEIVPRRLVEHLRRVGFVVMEKPPIWGASAFGRGFEGQ